MRFVPYYLYKRKLDYIVELEQKVTVLESGLLDIKREVETLRKTVKDLTNYNKERRKIDLYEAASLKLYDRMPKKERERLIMELDEMRTKLILYRWK